LMHVIAAKAVAFKEAMTPEFREYSKRITANARGLSAELKKLGFREVSGGTDNHLILIDLTATGVNGRDAEEALGRCNIVVNRNTVPFITDQKPTHPNGIRVGTPAVTTRGFGEAEMRAIARFISEVIRNFGNTEIETKIAAEVKAICERHPVPGVTD
jgi:glycine hydroxymethyltransferase